MATTFGDRLLQQLAAADMTAYQLGKRTGITSSYLSKILSGKQQPGWETVTKICDALGVSCAVFHPDKKTGS